MHSKKVAKFILEFELEEIGLLVPLNALLTFYQIKI
jgi:hypothetical protein